MLSNKKKLICDLFSQMKQVTKYTNPPFEPHTCSIERNLFFTHYIKKMRDLSLVFQQCAEKNPMYCTRIFKNIKTPNFWTVNPVQARIHPLKGWSSAAVEEFLQFYTCGIDVWGNSLHLLDLKYWLQGLFEPWKIFCPNSSFFCSNGLFVFMMTSNKLP